MINHRLAARNYAGSSIQALCMGEALNDELAQAWSWLRFYRQHVNPNPFALQMDMERVRILCRIRRAGRLARRNTE